MATRFMTICRALTVLVLILTTLAGCNSSTAGKLVYKPTPPANGQDPGFGPFLPSPLALANRESTGRTTSYSELQCIKHGSDYAGALPGQNIQLGVDNDLEFVPSWSGSGTDTAANLAYCIYQYSLPGFDRSALLRYKWSILPPSYDSVWFGLSNWTENRWDWFACEADGETNFGGTANYFDGDDDIYVVVLCANSGNNVLRHLRIGEQPDATFQHELYPRYPQSNSVLWINFANSYIPVGSIENYAWDLDYNGSFEDDTGTVTHNNTSFDTVGTHHVGIRLTSSFEEYYIGTCEIEVFAPWSHSWGTALFQDINAVTTDGSGHCYSAGRTWTESNATDALLVKHSLDGELVWAASWGGSGDETLHDVHYYDDWIYTVGQTESYGAGGYDVLLQRWSESGVVLWSRVIGTSAFENGVGLARVNNTLHIVGNTTSGVDSDVLVLEFGIDNSYKSASTWGGAGYDEATDVIAIEDNDNSFWYLLITGATNSPNVAYLDVMYMQIQLGGSAHQARTWRSDSESMHAGMSICGHWKLEDQKYIGGYLGAAGNRQALLLEVSTGGVAQTWAAGEESVAYGILSSVDSFYLVGRNWNTGGTTSGFMAEYDFVGDFVTSALWSDGGEGTVLNSLCELPGTGLLGVGNCQAAAGGSWGIATATTADPGGTWTDWAATEGFLLLSFANPTTEAQFITTGVVDEGNSSQDALLTVVEFP